MANTDERGGPVVDAAHGETARLAGDDIAILPDRKDRKPSRRTRALIIAAAIVAVSAIIVVVIVAFGAKSSSTTRVRTTNNPAKTPTVAKAPTASPPKRLPNSPNTVTKVVPTTPPAKASNTIGTPITATATTVRPPPTPPPTTPPALLGPKALQWHVTPAGTITIPNGGSVTMSVTVTNPTANPAYMPTPLSCLVMPSIFCPQHTDQLAAHTSASAHFTLHARDFSATPTKVYVGGYYAVTVKVA